MKTRLSITLDDWLVKKIDKKRNGVPRSTYINKLLLRTEIEEIVERDS